MRYLIEVSFPICFEEMFLVGTWNIFRAEQKSGFLFLGPSSLVRAELATVQLVLDGLVELRSYV